MSSQVFSQKQSYFLEDTRRQQSSKLEITSSQDTRRQQSSKLENVIAGGLEQSVFFRIKGDVRRN